MQAGTKSIISYMVIIFRARSNGRFIGIRRNLWRNFIERPQVPIFFGEVLAIVDKVKNLSN